MFRSEHRNKYPLNRQIAAIDFIGGPESPHKLIQRDTRVLAFGSCFAEHCTRFLDSQGYNQWLLNTERHPGCETQSSISCWNVLETLPVVVQQFRWAFEGFGPKSPIWFDRDKKLVEATQERRKLVELALGNAEVFVITLGLSEVWFDLVENEPMWQSVPKSLYEEGRYLNRRLTVQETVDYLYRLDGILDRHIPDRKVVFTVSSVPLLTTFSGQPAVVANQASKAILRAALDQFTRDSVIADKGRYFYFPSWEIVATMRDNPYLPDNIHIRPTVVGRILRTFTSLYTDLPSESIDRPANDSYTADLERQLLDAVGQLESKEIAVHELQKAAKDRLDLIGEISAEANREHRLLLDATDELAQKDRMIQELNNIAAERLKLIDRLHADLQKRRPWIKLGF